jgi:hypothetical protein
MGKNLDLIQILLIVITGMFIPFLGSLIIVFDVSPATTVGLITIGSTFGYFLLIFGLELAIVYVYFYSTNAIAQRKIDKEAKKRKEKK